MITESSEPGPVSRRYRAATRWDGLRWTVSIEDPNGHFIEATVAERLADVGDVAQTVVGEVPGDGRPVRGVDVAVDVLLPPAVELALERLTCPSVSRASILDQVVAALFGLGMVSDDVAMALNQRMAPTRERQLFVANADVVARGLGDRGEVLGVRCSEYRSQPLTYCHTCIGADRLPWIERPQGLSILVYDPPVHCDRCGSSVTARRVGCRRSSWGPGDAA